nr:hypothetical protein [Haloterrigena turkmenica]
MNADGLDPQAKAALERQGRLPLPHNRYGLKLLRLLTGPMMRLRNRNGPNVGRTIDRTIPGPAGDLDARLYLPAASGPYPTIVFFHGVHESGALVRSIRTLRFLRRADSCWGVSRRTTGSADT